MLSRANDCELIAMDTHQRGNSVEDSIIQKGLELGFSNVGFAEVRDYPEYLDEANSRKNYGIFIDNDALISRLSKTKTLNPWAKSIVCATLGFSSIDYPKNLLRSVARTYLARVYSPLPGTEHAAQIEDFASYIESLGIRVDRNQFNLPQRIACAEAGITTFGNNNFAYTEQDGSFTILVSFLIDRELDTKDPKIINDCPPDCMICMNTCPTGAITGPRKLDLAKCILFNNQRFSPGAQEEIWDEMGLHIHGCDVCQAVCPRNSDALANACEKDAFLEQLSKEFDLEKILFLDEAYYEEVVRPIMYNYIKDFDIFRRNAAIALGNSGDALHLPALRKARLEYTEPHVLAAIDWAIDRLEN